MPWSWPTSSAAAVLMMQAEAPPGKLAAELEAGSDFRYVVHQASGMVAAQLEVSIAQALIRLRGVRFRQRRPLTEVARGCGGQKAALRMSRMRREGSRVVRSCPFPASTQSCAASVVLWMPRVKIRTMGVTVTGGPDA